jgi:ubiquinone/menaquinone biosynthesis C-methylase UbiE
VRLTSGSQQQKLKYPSKSTRMENQIVSVHADVTDLPFAQNYFDAVISIDPTTA